MQQRHLTKAVATALVVLAGAYAATSVGTPAFPPSPSNSSTHAVP